MNQLFIDIAEELEKVEWEGEKRGRKVNNFPDPIPQNWPMASDLNDMMKKVDEQGRSVGEHVKGVVASINKLISSDLAPRKFLISSNDIHIDNNAYRLMEQARGYCWFEPSAPFKNKDNIFPSGVLRIAALYHDIGKLISGDHHVSRGVRYMRDISEYNRQDIEKLFDNVNDSRDFWALLRHHDVFGCLCTGEASLPALSAIFRWDYPQDETPPIEKTQLAYLSYLAWLNIADIDATLLKPLGGITTIEAYRYFTDWLEVKDYLADGQGLSKGANREKFRNWSLRVSSQPDRAIKRISRLIATCYRKEMQTIAPESQIEAIVQEELQALQGHRLERFCYYFARFCKLDYGLRFFYILMRDALLDENLLRRTGKSPGSEFPGKVKPTSVQDNQAKVKAIRRMVNKTCLVLHRIVEDYEDLVGGDQRVTPLLTVDMSGLMRPDATGWAICKSLKEIPSRALGWIADEVSVRLYN